jgi:hypothetical protein
VGNEYMLVITRKLFTPNKNHSVEIMVDGYMHTEFIVDGLMRNKVTKTINVYVEPKLVIPVKECNLKVLEKNALGWVVRPLAQMHETSSESVGFTEAGKSLVIKLELNVDKKEIKNLKVKINGLSKTPSVYNTTKDLAIKLELPKNIETTLYGEYSLREKYNNYNLLSRNEIGTRKTKPHTLEIEFEYDNNIYKESIRFDTLDTYLSNVNTKLSISTNSDEESYIKLTDWVEFANE